MFSETKEVTDDGLLFLANKEAVDTDAAELEGWVRGFLQA